MRTATDVSPQFYDRYVGEYEMPAEIGWLSFPPAVFSSIFVMREGDTLFLSAVPEMLPLELRPMTETRFFYADLSPDIPDFEVSFVADGSGNVTKATLDFEGLGTVPLQKVGSEVPKLAQLQLLIGEKAAGEHSGFSSGSALWVLVPVVLLVAAAVILRRVRTKSRPR